MDHSHMDHSQMGHGGHGDMGGDGPICDMNVSRRALHPLLPSLCE